jgi:hypothetical protein
VIFCLLICLIIIQFTPPPIYIHHVVNVNFILDFRESKMKPICPITNEPCFEAEYGVPKPCVENATLDSAAVCIRRLRKTNLEMANEIAALDELLESLREGKQQH